jgi:hypothetical protein
VSDIQTDLFLLLLRRRAQERGYVTTSDVEEVFWALSPELVEELNRVAGKLTKAKRHVQKHLLPGLITTARLANIEVRNE